MWNLTHIGDGLKISAGQDSGATSSSDLSSNKSKVVSVDSFDSRWYDSTFTHYILFFLDKYSQLNYF